MGPGSEFDVVGALVAVGVTVAPALAGCRALAEAVALVAILTTVVTVRVEPPHPAPRAAAAMALTPSTLSGGRAGRRSLRCVRLLDPLKGDERKPQS